MVTAFTGDYFFLHNSYPVVLPFINNVGTQRWAFSVEHAYQASKTLDTDRQEFILSAPTARAAWRLGNDRATALKPDWDSHKITVMRHLLQQKFSDRWLLLQLLRMQGEIRNTQVDDDTWGCHQDPDGQWHGYNWLGHLLRELRDLSPVQLEDLSDVETRYNVVTVERDGAVQAYFNHADPTTIHGQGTTPMGALIDLAKHYKH